MPLRPDSNASKFWIWKMAWRDARSQWRKLLFFAMSVVFGVAALVAISSFSENLNQEVERQAQELLGADLEFHSRKEFAPEVEAFFQSLAADDKGSDIQFSTMVYFPRNEETRLVRVRGMEGGFPWYGELDTIPQGLRVANNDEPVAIVEDSLITQHDLQVGDLARIGNIDFRIIGEMRKLPGETLVAGTFAPRILVPRSFIEETGLLQFGSRVRYRQYLFFEEGMGGGTEQMLQENREMLNGNDVGFNTIENRLDGVENTLEAMTSYLNLSGFVTLLLGCVGIAGAVEVYLREKIQSVALLRCLGCSSRQSFSIFCIQVFSTGLIGAAIGGMAGIGIQQLIPSVVEPFLPFELSVNIAWLQVLASMGFGWVFASLFAFIPLLPIRKVSPLRALRAIYEDGFHPSRDWIVWLVFLIIGLLALGFTLANSERKLYAAAFVVGLAGAVTILGFTGFVLRYLLRKTASRKLPYVWRQGLSNLYRPNNRTVFLTVILGMGFFLIYTLYLSEESLLRRSDMTVDANQPNVFFFDIQRDQTASVDEIIREADSYIHPQEPIVTMRLKRLNGLTREEIRESGEDIEGWAFRREYRSTYRDYIRDDEELIAGAFQSQASLDSGEPIPISVEERIVRALKLEIGDKMLWDVQGLEVETVVTSFRKVDWRRLRPNFFVVFPSGVLEEAPATFITAAKSLSREGIAKLQRDIVLQHPNVSAINLAMVLDSLKSIIDRVGFVVRFMASFTIATGLIALVSAVITSRYQRTREGVLLRTLGASASQIRKIMSIEYALIGALASVSGILLSLVGGWAIATYLFKVDFHIPWGLTLAAMGFASVLTLVTGLANSIGIADRPPLEALRRE